MNQSGDGAVDSDASAADETEDKNAIAIVILVVSLTGSVVSILGIWTNILSMAIFSKLGLKDSMSVELFALSLTDFLVATIQLASCVCCMMAIFYPDSSVDMLSLNTLAFGWIVNCFYFISCWITTVVSVERCVCVVFPFQVKKVFRRSVCVTTVIIIYAAVILINAPAYFLYKMDWIEVASILFIANRTDTRVWVYTVIINSQAEYFTQTLDSYINVPTTVIIQSVVIFCAIWMGYSLNVTSGVRKTNNGESPDYSKGSSGSFLPAIKLSNKEKRLVKIVFMLAMTMIAGNVPRFIIVALYYTLPEQNTSAQRDVQETLWAVSNLINSAGASVNVLVFCKLNTKYRSLFDQIFTVKCARNSVGG